MNKSEQKVLVDKDILALIMNALKRDAADGYVTRGEMLKMLEESISDVPAKEEFTTTVHHGRSGYGPIKETVRVTHNPSGMFAESSEARSQHGNAAIAKGKLVDMLDIGRL